MSKFFFNSKLFLFRFKEFYTKTSYLRKEGEDLYQSITTEISKVKNRQSSMITDEKEFKKLSNSIGTISKDVGRTFHNEKFEQGAGQLELGRVLEAISLIKSEIGYCQGMNFIAGGLICLTNSEEQAFWIFLIFLNHFELTNLFIKVI